MGSLARSVLRGCRSEAVAGPLERNRIAALALPLVLACGACASVPARPGPALARDEEPEILPTGPYVEAVAIPYLNLEADVDGIEPPGGVGPPDLRSGDGGLVAAGFLVDGFGFGGLFLAADHETREVEGEAELRAGFLELRLAGASGDERLATTLALGAGLGFGTLEFEPGAPFEDAESLLTLVRVSAGLLVGGHLALDLGIGFLHDLAGDDLGGGSFLSAGLALHL